MALRQYEGPGQIQIDGRTVAEAETVRLTVNSNNNRVYTMRRQFAGRSSGPTESEVSIDSAIPVAGFEVDYASLLVVDADVRVTMLAGGRRIQIDGYIDSVDISQGVQEMARISCRILGGPPSL